MISIDAVNAKWAPHTQKKLDLRPGYTVRVHQRIREGKKERVQIFEGLVIDVKDKQGPNQTITVRKISSGVGVERVFPVASPRIEKIVVVKKAKVRRAKLSYMRNLTGKAARLKETLVSETLDRGMETPEETEPAAKEAA